MKNITNKLEDFDDEEFDENVSNVKNSQIKQISESHDIRNNNLNQIMLKNYNNEYKNNNNQNNNNESNINNNLNKNMNNNINIKYNKNNLNQNFSNPKNINYSDSISNLTNNQNILSKDSKFNFLQMMTNMNFSNNYNQIQNLNIQNNKLINNNKQIQNNKNIIVNNLNYNYNIPPQIYIQNYSQLINQYQNIYNNNNNNRLIQNCNQINTTKNCLKDKKIKIEDIIIGKEKRTTLMLRNIPNKYTLNNIVEEIDKSFWGKYDYINLPIDYERKLNLGYSFINFVDPMHIILFYETYYMKKWSKYKSDKKINLSFADKQGKKDINCKDDQTYFAIDDKRFIFNSLQPKIEIPICHLNFFRKIYPNSVCIIEDKHGFYNDKCFIVKHLGKK